MRANFKATGLAASAALFALGTMAGAASPPTGSTGKAVGKDDVVHCYGINSCKGQADCKTSLNACKGQNSCKGHGFKALAAGSCLAKGGVIGDLS